MVLFNAATNRDHWDPARLAVRREVHRVVKAVDLAHPHSAAVGAAASVNAEAAGSRLASECPSAPKMSEGCTRTRMSLDAANLVKAVDR